MIKYFRYNERSDWLYLLVIVFISQYIDTAPISDVVDQSSHMIVLQYLKELVAYVKAENIAQVHKGFEKAIEVLKVEYVCCNVIVSLSTGQYFMFCCMSV